MKKVALFLILLSVQLVYGQNADWEVVVYATTEQAILVLTPDGVSETIPVPDEVSGRIALSHDRRYLAFGGSISLYEGLTGMTVEIADLIEQTCCISVTSQKTELEGMSAISYTVGAFNPQDSNQVAILYGALPEGSEGAIEFDPTQYGVMVVDIETRDVISHYRIGTWENFIGWNEAGILWSRPYSLPPGAMGEPYQASRYQVWNPATRVQGIIPAYSVAYFDGDIDIGETLELTGEHIVSSFATANPESEYSPYHFVLLYQSRDAQVGVNYRPKIIHDGGFVPRYFNRSGYRTARWIADGNAIYLRLSSLLPYQPSDPDTASLLLRDGTLQTINVPLDHEFLGGTPDGWLAYDGQGISYEDNNFHIYHYQYENGDVDMKILAEFDVERTGPFWSLTLLQTTPLGATAETTEFPAIELREPLG